MLTWLHTIVAESLTVLRDVIGQVTGPDTGLTWALAIIVLSVLTRLLLLPLNVRQFHAQAKMQKVQPQLQKVNERFKQRKADLDKAPLSAEERQRRLRELQAEQLAGTRSVTKEHNFRFSSLFLPMIVQGLIGYSLFQVLRTFRPGGERKFGLSAEELASGSDATFLGAPLSSTLTTASDVISRVGGDPVSARIGALVLLVAATAVSILTLKQALGRTSLPVPAAPSTGSRSGPPTPEEAMAEMMGKMQSLMRTKGPLILGLVLSVFYVFLPIGLLLSILVVVVWTAGYQWFMHRRHPKSETLGKLESASGETSEKGSVKADKVDKAAVKAVPAEVASGARPANAGPAKPKPPQRPAGSRPSSSKKGKKKRR